MFDVSQKAYISLRDIVSERTNRLVLWTGAGLSKQAELPDWSGLKRELCTAIKDKYERQGDQRILERVKLAEGMEDLWIAFQILRELCRTTYNETIREAFKNAPRCPIPPVYGKLWKLPVKGILTLNLDRLSTRAYTAASPGGAAPQEFIGKNAGQHIHLLRNPYPFIANLHGTFEDSSSWVLGKDQLTHLLNQDGYIQLVNSVLTSGPVVFLGINASDVAAGGFLDKLASFGADIGVHYWITDRKDIEAHKWAESVGLRMIVYDAPGNNHSDLSSLLDDLVSFVSVEPSTFMPQVVERQSIGTELEGPEKVALLPPETIRQVLNEKARQILSDRTDIAYGKFESFRKAYGRAIHQSWYVDLVPPDNRLLGYILKREIAEGAFGRVFEAEDSSGCRVAIKLLKEDVGRKPEMLRCFRRGVLSMGILARYGVSGMVPYIESSEIPAFIAMNFIDGPDLKEAVEAGFISDWHDILRISRDIARILHKAHKLPERVLHRDLRPPNIMLKGYYTEPLCYEVVVLDFDLSWHQGAIEDSIAVTSLNGFLAPEQVERIHSASTRNALVDSFGLGMLMLYIATKQEPNHLHHRHSGWKEFLNEKVAKYFNKNWVSLPNRFTRLIDTCTRDIQSQRWDMAQIVAELERLYDAECDPKSTMSSELVAEEIVARAMNQISQPQAYLWNSEDLSSIINLSGGVYAKIRGNETIGNISLLMEWNKLDHQNRKSVDKWYPKASTAAQVHMAKGGWVVTRTPTRGGDSATATYSIETVKATANLDSVSKSVAQALREMHFEY